MKKLIKTLNLFFIFLLFSACSKQSLVKFEFMNNSNSAIQNISIAATEELCSENDFIETLEVSHKETLALDFSHQEGSECVYPKGDGEYVLKYEAKNQQYSFNFGYYTAGKPLENKFKIKFLSENKLAINGSEEKPQLSSNQPNAEILDQETKEMESTQSCKKNECGTSSIPNLKDCNLTEYGLDCAMVKFLEENLAWTTEEGGIDFCAYKLLGKKDSSSYLQVMCSEFYVQDRETVCPDLESREECFVTKDIEKKVCQEKCEINEVNPYLVTGGGLSIPVKITKEDDGRFELWEPRDGSYYTQDLKENFPAKIYANLKNIDKSIIKESNIQRAEKYFGTKVRFNVSGALNQACEINADCGTLPMEYALRSTCPHEVKCLENQCVAGCYDFVDNHDLPLLKRYTWSGAVELIHQGKVKQVSQSHALDVELILKDDSSIRVKEPKIDSVFQEVEKCGELCEDIVLITE